MDAVAAGGFESERALAGAFAAAMLHAGEALAEMSGHGVTIVSPCVKRCSASAVLEMAGGAEQIVVAVYIGIQGPLSGHALLMLPPEGAHRLAQLLLMAFGEQTEVGDDPLSFDDMELSALGEVGNVTISAFLNEIAVHLTEPVVPTPPQAVVEMAGAILDGVLMDLVTESEHILAAETTFREGDVEVEGMLLVLPRPAPLLVLMNALAAEHAARRLH